PSWRRSTMQREQNRGRVRGAFATAVLFSLCAWLPQRAAAQQSVQDLAGTTWRLTSLTMEGQTVTPDDRQKYTLSVDKKANVAIHADCNRGRGRYMDPSGALEINKVTLTKAHCDPGSIADQFAAQSVSRSRTRSRMEIFISRWCAEPIRCDL